MSNTWLNGPKEQAANPVHETKPLVVQASGTEVVRSLGLEFLSYATASTPEALEMRLTADDPHPLSEPQERALRSVVHVLVSMGGATPLQMNLANVFGSHEESKDTSLVNALRLNAGGTIWAPGDGDALEQELLVQLRDIYPIFLLPEDQFPFSMGGRHLGTSLFNHPRRSDLEQAVLAHPTISRMFPTESETSGRYGNLYSSTGFAGGVQLWSFADQLIKSGWEFARLSATVPTPREHGAGLSTALAALISALQNKPATVPVRVGLAGVLFPEGLQEIDLGWARVRAVDDRDLSAGIEQTIPGALHSSDESGQNVEIKYRGDLVVEMDIPYRVRVEELKIEHGWPEGFNPHRLIEQRIDNLRLGMILADTSEPRSIVLQSWIRIFDPVRTSGLGWRDPQLMRNLYPKRLSSENVEEWRKWATLVAENRQGSVDVAVRRALLAVSERNTPEDMLVDSVIVWENLFGANQETTMRVTGSLAWLLGNGSEDRKTKQALYKRIYALRSGVVHGALELKKSEDLRRPHEALEIALEALRVVFRDRPDLLAEKDSTARSNRLLLGD